MISSLIGGKLVDMISNRHVFIISAVLPLFIFISGFILLEINIEKPKYTTSIGIILYFK